MTIVKRNAENLSGTTEKFFRMPAGFETQILTEAPEEWPSPGFIDVYIKNGTLYYLDENGIETAIATGGGGSSGGGTLPGVEVDCGSFLVDTANIDCGVFV